MKKKSVRKVSATKKVISKAPLKKSKSTKKTFSLKSWLLGGLVLLVAATYGLYQYNLQPKGIKVLEIPGTVLDYLEPEAVSINAIKSCEKDPECADLVDKAAQNKAPVSFTTQSKSTYTVAKSIVESTDKNLDDIKEEAEEIKSKTEIAANQAVQFNKVVQSNVVNTESQPCQTSVFSVNSGETMIGQVANSQTAPNAGEYTGANIIMECSNGSWEPTGCYEKGGQILGPSTCRLTVKPVYAQGQNERNCYEENGAIVVGHNSVIESVEKPWKCVDGGHKEVTKVDGVWMTDEEKLKYEEDKKRREETTNALREKACVADGGTYKNGACTVDSRVKTCVATPGNSWDSTKGVCVSNKSNLVNPDGTKTGGELTTNSKDCIFGGTPTGRGDSRSAEFRCNDSTGKVPQTTEKCQAQGTVVVCKVYDLTGKYLSEYRKTTETIKNEVNPNGIYQNGEETTKEADCIYGAEVIRAGSNGAVYRCYNSDKKFPLSETKFGETSPVNPGDPLVITDNSSEKLLPTGSKCADGMYNTILGNIAYKPKCQNQCEGGVYTTVSYGFFGIRKIAICGSITDDNLVATVNALRLSERNVTVIADNRSELTTKNLSKCSNALDSDNLCQKCEVGVVTDVETADETFRFCGSKDEVAILVKNNPNLLLPEKDSSSEEYVPYPLYKQDNSETVGRDNDYVPYPLYNQQNDDAFNFEDMPGISEAQQKSGAAGSAIGEALLKAWTQTWNTILGIREDTNQTLEYASTLDDPADPPVRPTKPAANPGTVKLKGECFVHSDCEPGLHCKTTWGNLQTSTCAKSSTEIVEKGVVGQNGKLSVGTPCYDDNQCESGATCKKTILPDTCQPKKVPIGGSVVQDKEHKYKQLPTGSGIYSYTHDGVVYIILPAGYSESDLMKLNNIVPPKSYDRPKGVKETIVAGPGANSQEVVYEGPDGLYNDSYCETDDVCASGYCKPYNFVNNPRSHCSDPE